MAKCPDKVIVSSGRMIGLETTTIFNSLGKEVVIVEMISRILPETDIEISNMFRRSLVKNRS